MSRFNKSVILFLLLTCLGLVLKKLMIPGASLLLVIVLTLLAMIYFIQGIRTNIHRSEEDNSSGVFIAAFFAFSVSSIAFLFRVHYWSAASLFLPIAFISLIAVALLLIRYFIFRFTERGTETKIIKELTFPFLIFSFLISISVITNQRQFHNFFKGSTYESFVRKMYPENEAQLLLEENQCDDLPCLKRADEYFLRGVKNDSLEKWDEAFDDYNKAIDYNIHFAEAYCRRASNRMLHKELDAEIILAAIRDCDIAISLDSTMVMAYVRRGFTQYNAKHLDKACTDLKKAKQLDSTLNIDKYIKYSCGN